MTWRVSAAREPCATFLPAPVRGRRQPSASGRGEVALGSPGGGVARAQDPLPAGQGPLQQRDRPGRPARLPTSRGSNGKQHRQRDTPIMKTL